MLRLLTLMELTQDRFELTDFSYIAFIVSFAYSFYLIFGYKKASELAERKAAISQRATLRHANASLGNNKHYTGKPHDMPMDSSSGGGAVADSEESVNDFDSPGHAFVKTIVMFTGETITK